MNWNEIEKGEFYTYKDERGKEKRVKALTGNRTVKIDLRRDKIEKCFLIIEDDCGIKRMISSDSKNFSEIHPFKSELPDTGLICSKDDSLLIMKTGAESGYGFTYLGKLVQGENWYFKHQDWRPATKEDKKRWKELLTEEAKRRGYVKGAKVECLSDGKVYTLDGGLRFNMYLLSAFSLSTTELSNVRVMKNGKWAKIIEKESGIDVNKQKLLDDSITALKNYLNAGDKEHRRASSVIAKKVIEKYDNLNK